MAASSGKSPHVIGLSVVGPFYSCPMAIRSVPIKNILDRLTTPVLSASSAHEGGERVV